MTERRHILKSLRGAAARFFTGPGAGYALFLLAVIAGSAIFLSQADSPWKKGLESLPPGARPSVKHFAASGLWWGAVINLCIASVLLALRGWWGAPAGARAPAPAPSGTGQGALFRRSPALFAALLAAAAALCAWNAWPRMSLSLWGDEEHTLRTYILGAWEKNEAGEPELKRVNWQRSFFGYVNPNNHLLNTILARISLEIWQSFAGATAPLPFSEAALRAPAFAAGVLGVVAIGLFIARLGYPGAGVFAALICAMHPWYLRYTSEARGYGLMLLFLPLGLWFAAGAWRDGRLRQWLGFGLCQFCCLYAYPGAFHLLLMVNTGLFVAMLWRAKTAGQKLWPLPSDIGRWAAGCAAGAMLFIQLYAPCYPQLKRYMQGSRAQAGEMDLFWFRDLAGYLAIGTPWSFADAGNTLVVTIERLVKTHPHLPYLFALLILAEVAGFILLVRGSAFRKVIAAAFTIVTPVTIIHAKSINNFLYPWYVIFELPINLILMSIGLAFLCGLAARVLPSGNPFRAWAGAVPALIFLAWFWHATSPQRALLQTSPVEQQRESVLACRPELGAKAPSRDSIITVQIRRGGGHMMTVPSYDPALDWVENAAELRALALRADAERKPLFVNLAMPELARQPGNFPDIMALLDDPEIFTLHRTLPGLHDNTTRYVYRYNPGALRRHGG